MLEEVKVIEREDGEARVFIRGKLAKALKEEADNLGIPVQELFETTIRKELNYRSLIKVIDITMDIFTDMVAERILYCERVIPDEYRWLEY